MLGAAILAGVGAGVCRDVRDALATIPFPLVTYEPDAARFERYGDLYSRIYSKIPGALEAVYGGIHTVHV